MGVEKKIVDDIRSDKRFFLNKNGQAMVFALTSTGYVTHGDTVSGVFDSPHAREQLVNLCVGATQILSSIVYVAYYLDNKVNVMRSNEFTKRFPVAEYESPIAL